jgi:UDP-glucose 4-epimerase
MKLHAAPLGLLLPLFLTAVCCTATGQGKGIHPNTTTTTVTATANTVRHVTRRLLAADASPQISWNRNLCTSVSFVERVLALRRGPKRRVLVTGAGGFIGSHVAEFLSEILGWETIAVDDLSGGFKRNIPKNATFVNVDLKRPQAVAHLFDNHGPFDYVYHLAAYAAEGLSHFIRRFNYRNNLEASVSIINQCVVHKVKTIVFTSSIAAYGAPTVKPFIEELPQHPEDPYGISKHAVELDLKAAHEMFGLNFVVFRPHNVYGPRQNIADKFRNAIGIFMNQIMHDEPMTIFGDGKQTRGFSYIDDVSPFIAVSPEVPEALQQGFFVGSDTAYSVNDLANAVAKAMGVPSNLKHLEARNEVADAYASHEKLRCFFNPPPPVALEVGLARTAQYAKSIGKFEPTGFTDIEVWDKMPPSWVVALKKWEAEAPAKLTKPHTGHAHARRGVGGLGGGGAGGRIPTD